MTNFSTVFRLAPISLLLFVVTACSLTGQAKNHEEATRDVISDGLVLFKPLSRLGSGEPLAVFGLPVMGQTNFVSAEALCEGAAGSVLPPLAFKQCSTGVVMSPFRVLESALGPLGGRTISLPGLERFWVSQKKDNLCWAAAIEIVRGYLHLSHVTHLTMPATVAKEALNSLTKQKEQSYSKSHLLFRSSIDYMTTAAWHLTRAPQSSASLSRSSVVDL